MAHRPRSSSIASRSRRPSWISTASGRHRRSASASCGQPVDDCEIEATSSKLEEVFEPPSLRPASSTTTRRGLRTRMLSAISGSSDSVTNRAPPASRTSRLLPTPGSPTTSSRHCRAGGGATPRLDRQAGSWCLDSRRALAADRRSLRRRCRARSSATAGRRSGAHTGERQARAGEYHSIFNTSDRASSSNASRAAAVRSQAVTSRSPCGGSSPQARQQQRSCALAVARASSTSSPGFASGVRCDHLPAARRSPRRDVYPSVAPQPADRDKRPGTRIGEQVESEILKRLWIQLRREVEGATVRGSPGPGPGPARCRLGASLGQGWVPKARSCSSLPAQR